MAPFRMDHSCVCPLEYQALLDVCNDEVLQIKKLRQYIDDCYVDATEMYELQVLHGVVNMLNVRFKRLDDVRKAYLAKLNNPYLKSVQLTTATIEGGLVLASGFFAGKSLRIAVATFWCNYSYGILYKALLLWIN